MDPYQTASLHKFCCLLSRLFRTILFLKFKLTCKTYIYTIIIYSIGMKAWAISLKNCFFGHHPNDPLKMPSNQNILWTFQRNNFLILILDISSLFLMSFYEISEKKIKYLPTWKIMSRVTANKIFLRMASELKR